MFLNNSPTPLEPWKSTGQGTIDWPTAQVFQSSSTALVPKGNLAPPRPRLECLHPRSFQDLFFPSLSHSWCLENQEFMEEYGESVAIRGNWKDFHLYFSKTCLLKGADQLRSTQNSWTHGIPLPQSWWHSDLQGLSPSQSGPGTGNPDHPWTVSICTHHCIYIYN